jgi:choline dehydrogenase-like flavoprotein
MAWMPTIPRANINLTCIMIAERVADWNAGNGVARTTLRQAVFQPGDPASNTISDSAFQAGQQHYQ